MKRYAYKKWWSMGLAGLMLATASSYCSAAQQEYYLSDTIAELEKEWPVNRTVNIVCHGHSVPAGYFKTPEVDTFNAYPHLLHVALKQSYPHAVINVIVTGIGGENSVQGARRFEQDVLSHNPDVITIDYALNDRRVGLEAAKEAWVEMILSAKEKGVKVILLTPTGDSRSKLDVATDPLNQHAEQIRRLAKEYDVGLADSLAAFKGYVAQSGKLEDLLSHINHPNRKGHELVVDELVKWFVKEE